MKGPWLAAGLAALLAVSGLAATFAVPDRDTPVSDVREYTITDREHVLEPHWTTVPPAGGDHAPAWLACGVYDRPVDEGLVVHALEHGTVWIAYDPSAIDRDGVGRLTAKLPDEGILSPHHDLPGPVVVTVWGRQLVLKGADDAGLDAFLAEYGDGHTAPEARASCHGGVVAYDGPEGVAA